MRRFKSLSDAEDLGDLPDATSSLRPGDPPGFQAEGEVIEDIQMGIEGGSLKDHGDIPPVRRDAMHVPPRDRHGAGVRRFESGDDPQERGLARAGRAEHDDAFALRDAQAERLERGGSRSVFPGDLPQLDHGRASPDSIVGLWGARQGHSITISNVAHRPRLVDLLLSGWAGSFTMDFDVIEPRAVLPSVSRHPPEDVSPCSCSTGSLPGCYSSSSAQWPSR